MTINQNIFTSNSLVGSLSVLNGYANLSLGTRPLVFEGDQSFVIRLRRNSSEGDIVISTPPIILKDNSNILSVTSNTSNVIEGSSVTFTVNTANVPDNTQLFYSTLGVTGTVNAADFVGGNTGSFTILNNIGNLTLNVASDNLNETTETFRLQIRKLSSNGQILTQSNIITISNFRLTQNRTNLNLTDSVNFSITTTNVSNNYILYYRTIGNVISSDFAEGNTGSFALVNNNANIILTSNYGLFTEKSFNLQILEGAIDGDVIFTSNTVILNPASPYIQATGGTVTTSIDPISNLTYTVHTFTTSGIFNVTKLGVLSSNVEYVAVAGGGSGGARPNHGGGGGGAGGMLVGNITINSLGNYSMVVGAGGGGGTLSSSPLSVPGSNTSIFSNTIVVLGGGRGSAMSSPTPDSNFINGGSGGGGSGFNPADPSTRGTGTPGQGNPGGFGWGSPSAPVGPTGGGGGGAAAAGTFASLLTPVRAGSGGAGRLVYWLDIPQGSINPTGPGRYLAGGGGGGKASSPENTNGLGGIGGGGRGYFGASPENPSILGYANVNTGGGGGGSFGTGTGPTSYFGAGGSGIVILRYRS